MPNRRHALNVILSGAAAWSLHFRRLVAAPLLNQASLADFPSGDSDDTSRLRAAFRWLQAEQNRTLVLETKRYVVSNRIDLTGAQNFRIEGNGATIAAADNMPVRDGFQILCFRQCTDGEINDLTVDGNRSHRRPGEVPAHSVQIYSSCARLTFTNVRSHNAAVDGFYVACESPNVLAALPTDIVFRDCRASNAYRNNVSVINSNRFRDYDGVYADANGTLPMAGIDFEPNDPRNLGNIDVQCFRTQCNNNKGPGFQVDGGNTHAVLHNVVAKGNGFGGIVGAWGYLRIDGVTLDDYGANIRRGIIDAFYKSGETHVSNVVARHCNTGSDSKPIIYVHPIHIGAVTIINVETVQSSSPAYGGASNVLLREVRTGTLATR
ncbi:hypothetical protein [Paraburkholderia metrosideri]|uniref:Right handed beta helix domain-containing protein n=1 Tax=Paraburkholderia metrosideri TaxID=580937 RepID=A0ABM8NH13_9BURK|nr:hypothetical protein [Paraburkholderia metrosideri]CAD6524720.1 hypothetical protein LMG28140_01672 [Paraburkholderia metrosideri]